MPYSKEERRVLEEFGRRIRDARDAHEWTQDELASRAGLDRTYVGAIERGERNVALLNINKLALTLGESFEGFLPFRIGRRRK